jgi:hypothetical protein
MKTNDIFIVIERYRNRERNIKAFTNKQSADLYLDKLRNTPDGRHNSDAIYWTEVLACEFADSSEELYISVSE